jgi:hypothetical protein
LKQFINFEPSFSLQAATDPQTLTNVLVPPTHDAVLRIFENLQVEIIGRAATCQDQTSAIQRENVVMECDVCLPFSRFSSY